MIDVANDAEGVQMALEEIFEEDYVRSRIERESAGANEATRDRLSATVPARTLSPGYYDWGLHLLRLESEHKVGVGLYAHQVRNFEVRGLLALSRARTSFEGKHPACSACGARQATRFSAECLACGSKFSRKK